MSSRIKFRACAALASALEAAVPRLAGKTMVARSDAERWAVYPGLCVVPLRMRYEAGQACERDFGDIATSGPPLGTLTEQVGAFTGIVRLQLTALSAPAREDLEDAVVNYLLSWEGHPGVRVITLPDLEVGGVATLYEAPCAFTLDDAEWRDEQVYEQKRFTWIDLDLATPALIARDDVPQLQQIIFAFETDLAQTETVQVDEDGGLTPTV
jgi:hypothetical protein